MMTREQSLQLEAQLKALSDQPAGDAGRFDAETAELCFVAGEGEAHGRSPPDVRGDSSRGGILNHGVSMLGCTLEGDASHVGSALEGRSTQRPGVMDLQRASGGLIEVLARGGGVELWCENRCLPDPLPQLGKWPCRMRSSRAAWLPCGCALPRGDARARRRYASLERYLAFLVVFHQMAASVAAFPPLAFDISRSQSQLRVATTAAPISGAELEKEWAADAAGPGHVFAPGCEILPDPTEHVSFLGLRNRWSRS
jgi:hypothetical protein